MSIPTIEYKGKSYPRLQAEGFASQYSFPFASKICQGSGIDIGCMKADWSLPGSFPIDVSFPDGFHAMNIPMPQGRNGDGWDYLYSSHCLEHLYDWVKHLDYWHSKLKSGGICFLYLPDCDKQEYWRPFNNRKHCNWLRPDMLEAYFNSGGWRNVFVTGSDLNYSFYAIAEKI